ncbi:PAS domain S-box protein [Rubrivivax sp. RP6-9]|uniref:PAS domain S-box protein n=1 Tax=Rubrivivax sp. RP6-9 TaxID=3415750 RepID=UPI003CC5624B
MPGPVDDLRRRQRQEWWALAMVLLGVALLVAALRWNAREQIEQSEGQRLDVQARAVQEILSRQIESVHAALQGVREHTPAWRSGDFASNASRRLKALTDAIPGLAMLALLDQRGTALASSRLTMIGTDLSTRATVAADRMVALGPPRRDATGQISVDLVMPLPAAEGGGSVIATLDAEYFRLVMRSVLYAPDMRVGLVHGSGSLVMFEPPMARAEGYDVRRPGTVFQRHVQSGRDSNLFLAQVLITGDLRHVSVRTLRPQGVPIDPPLVLAVSRDAAAVLAPWREQTQWVAATYMLFVGGMALALALLQKRQRALHQLQLQADTRQRAEAERLALALSGADLGMWDLDMTSRSLTINARWAQILGREHADVGSDFEDWRALVHPEDLERVEALLQNHLDGHSALYEAVYRMRHRDGRWVWILARGQVLERSAAGQPLRMLGTHQDLTQRVEAEQALRDRERQLRTVADAVPGPVSRVDRAGRYLFTNAAYERWFGGGRASLVGVLQREVLGDKRYALIEPYLQRALAGESVSYETPVRTGDGVLRWALVTLVPDRDAGGAVCGHFTVLYDISDRKRAEDALRSSEGKSRALLENLMIGVVVHDANTQVLEANPAACRLLGLSLEQLRGAVAVDPRWQFVEEDGRPMPIARFPVAQVATSGQPLSNLVGGILRPGQQQPTWVLCNAFPMRTAAGQLDQILVTFLDITDRRRADLERQTLERQLRESQRMESIGTLAGGIAHDFNNILAAILGNVALARQDVGVAHPAQTSLAQIQRAGLRARALVQQILTFSSRRDPGLLQVQPLGAIVEETMSLLRATLPATVRLEAVACDDDVPVRADATQVQQVLMNLATNAWHALPGSGGRIEIGIARLDAVAAAALALQGLPAGPLAHLWVRDNGSGMDAATRARIFDPFFTTKPVGLGTGLGLSVVHGIVRAHQGAIDVDSAPGQGSCFHLYFPSPEGTADRSGDDADDDSSTDGGGRRVLLVDDDEVVVLMAERLLQRAGYEVSSCGRSGDALARVAADPQAFDVVVTDFNMPEMSGLELASALHQLRPDLPLVLSSGLMSEALREQARQVGVRVVLKKENSVDELADAVARALAG